MTDTFITKLQNMELQILEIMVAYSDFNVQIRSIENQDQISNFDKETKKKLESRCEAIYNFISKISQN